ncbi:hypothetical protein WA158_007924 [Blastocystis sp. Blastoise]
MRSRIIIPFTCIIIVLYFSLIPMITKMAVNTNNAYKKPEKKILAYQRPSFVPMSLQERDDLYKQKIAKGTAVEMSYNDDFKKEDSEPETIALTEGQAEALKKDEADAKSITQQLASDRIESTPDSTIPEEVKQEVLGDSTAEVLDKIKSKASRLVVNAVRTTERLASQVPEDFKKVQKSLNVAEEPQVVAPVPEDVPVTKAEAETVSATTTSETAITESNSNTNDNNNNNNNDRAIVTDATETNTETTSSSSTTTTSEESSPAGNNDSFDEDEVDQDIEHFLRGGEEDAPEVLNRKYQNKNKNIHNFDYYSRFEDRRFFEIDREIYNVPEYVSTTNLPRMKLDAGEFLAITSADDNSIDYAVNLIYSIADYNINVPVLFIDFGLSRSNLQKLWKCFDFIHNHREYQKYVLFYYKKVNWYRFILHSRHDYYVTKTAVRSVVLVDSLQEVKSRCIWFDPNSEILDHFDKITDALEQYGFVSPLFGSTLSAYIRPETLDELDAEVDFSLLQKPLCSAGIYGFDYNNHDVYTKIASTLRHCAYGIQCYNPANSTHLNNRYDESIITYLAYKHQVPLACSNFGDDVYQTNLFFKEGDNSLLKSVKTHRRSIAKKYNLNI